MRDIDRVEVASQADLRRFLQGHHGQAEAIWLVTFKKSAGGRYLPYDVVVEEALAFGWIDSLPRGLDADRTMRLLAPRKPGSAWSAANKRRVEKLQKEGRMTAAGTAAVERAKADGSWNRIDDAQALRMPVDLAAAMTPSARANFDAFPPSTRRAIYEWIGAAKTAQTRARRINETAEKATRGVRANQWRQPKA